jgi:upstream activation factor subunit UAF30
MSTNQNRSSRKSVPKVQPVSQSSPAPSSDVVVSQPVDVKVVVEKVVPQSLPVEVQVVEPKPLPVVSLQQSVSETTEQVAPEVNHFDSLNAKLKQVQSLLRDLSTELNVLSKEVDKLRKSSKKSSSRSSRKQVVAGEETTSSNARSGINKEVNVSDELAKFLGISLDQKVSRIQVSRKISEYIRANNLQNPENRRLILLDEKLTKLFNPPKDVVLSYFNMQTYLKPHYK